MFKALLGLKIADGSILQGVPLQYNASDILSSSFLQADWLRSSSRALAAQAANEGIGVARVAMAIAEQAVLLAKNFGGSAGPLVDDVKSEMTDFALHVGRAIANAHQDLVTKFVDTILDLQALSHSESRALVGELKAGIDRAADADVEEMFEEALNIIESAAQVVVIRSGSVQNPFDDSDFDPETPANTVGDLTEGAAKTFTAYLPYEAGKDGQKIKINISGATGENIELFGADESALRPDGTFTVTIPEGQRQASFAIAALEDLDASQAITVSARLVKVIGGDEVSTHLAHEEATLLLQAENEAAPAGGLEYHGDWAAKLVPGGGVDENGNPIFIMLRDTRYPVTSNNMERIEGGPPALNFGGAHPIVGIDGPDHIWTGMDKTFGSGGDDYIEGMVGVSNFIIGDDAPGVPSNPGNDTIEGGENTEVHFPEGLTYNGVEIQSSGDDIILGGGGDDDLYADRIALLDELLNPSTPALDMLGDWITGERGDDHVYGSAAHDALFGGGGADVIRGGAGNDVLDGDDNLQPLGIPFWQVQPDGFGVTFYPVTNIYLSFGQFEYYRDYGGDDVLDGGSGSDLIFGMIGNDVLIGGDGEDRLEGWDGDDQLFGGDDNDFMVGDFGLHEAPGLRIAGVDYLAMPGVMGRETEVPAEFDQRGNDFLDGGAGHDRMYGDGGDDTLFGRDGDDQIYGDGNVPDEWHGNDFLDGGEGIDALFGGAGDDRLFGGADNDWLMGDAGADYEDGGLGDDFVFGGEGDDVLKGGSGNDVLVGEAGADVLDGDDGADQLNGGWDDDVLHGGAGADTLDGAEGADTLLGGFGDDALFGGDGDDRLDGGIGADTVFGGAGNDTYVYGFGYGQEVIDDGEGVTSLAFNAGIGAEDLSISLNGETVGATISFGGLGDSLTVNFGSTSLRGIEFADGSAWDRKQVLNAVPALVSAGSTEAELLIGNEHLRNELLGFGGDDSLVGSGNDDVLAGGEGADVVDGAAGSDVYRYGAGDLGIDQLSDNDIQASAYVGWFYANLGIADYAERGEHGGEYRVSFSLEGDAFTYYFDSAEEAQAAHPFAEISYIEPLPAIVPLIHRDDAAALEQLAEAGVISRDVVAFEDGLAFSDLSLTVTVDGVAASKRPDHPWHQGGVLSVRWADGSAGFDLNVPGVTYGFSGENLMSDGFDSSDNTWRGYRLGEGIEAFSFAGGTSYSLEQILRHAQVVEAVPEYRFSRYSGTQVISQAYPVIRFDDDIRWEELVVTRDGADLLLALSDGNAQGRIEGWYADPSAVPQLSLRFGSDPDVTAETLTELGLRVDGTDGDDVLAGSDDFGDILHGGAGNDILDGGAGKDKYVFHRGDGIDQIVETPAGPDDPEASIVVIDDFFSWEAHFGLGSLLLDLGNGDAIHFTGFNALDPYSTPVFDRLEFADGESLSFADAMAMGFQFFGTDEDDVITGTGVIDFIDGGDGRDVLQGFAGDDTLQGGEGADTYVYMAGDGGDYIVDWDETPGELDTLRLQGLAPEQVHITRDDYSYYLVLEDGARIMLDSAAREPVAEIELVEFDDGTIWTPSDLASRVELLPGTERDDVLWGTAHDDSIHGFAGNDALFGNGGDDLLAGGEGSDHYLFASGDGNDVVDNYDEDGSPDFITFSEAASTDAVLLRAGNDLVVAVGGGSNSIALVDWYLDTNRKIESIFFGGDATSWDAALLEELAPAEHANTAPTLTGALEDQIAVEDEAFTYQVPAGSFGDADSDELAFSATLGDGSDLPAWLSFDADLQGFSGTPANGDVGALEVVVTATDPSGASASDTFSLEIRNTNDAPTVLGAVPDAVGREGDTFSLHVPASIFSDPDAGDSLTLSASGPSWLSFQNGVFTGTPGSSDAGEYVLQVIATDNEGASADTSFRLTVVDVPANGDRIVGTRRDDVLVGTDADEVLIGKRGADLLLAGGGDDVLRGGRGDDLLRGGAGNDVYVHGRHGGDDVIVEAGGADVLRFGQGITRAMVNARRVRDDLVLDVSGGHGSVQVRDWFGAADRRVERIEFAGGAVWDEDKIRSLVKKSGSTAMQHVDLSRERVENESSGSAGNPHSRKDHPRDESAAAIWQRLSTAPELDFEALLRAPASKERSLSPQEIARQWALAHDYASALAYQSDDGMTAWSSLAGKSGASVVAGFGFEGSIGATRSQDGLKALEGLSEGFRKL